MYGMGEGELAYFEEAPGRGGRGVNQGSGELESQRSDRWHALTALPPHSQGIHCLARHANNTECCRNGTNLYDTTVYTGTSSL